MKQKTIINLKTIIFCVIAFAMFVCGISTLASFAYVKPAQVNVNNQKVDNVVNAEDYEARIDSTYFATLEEAFDYISNSTEDITCSIYVLKDVEVERTLVLKVETGLRHTITMLCDGSNVTITRTMDKVLFDVGLGVKLTIGSSVDDENVITFNGNNKSYSMFTVGYGASLTIYSGNYYGNLDGIATVGPAGGGCIHASSEESVSVNIIGGTFKNFMATDTGGVINTNVGHNIFGGIFENNTAKFGGVAFSHQSSTIGYNAIMRNNTANVGGALLYFVAIFVDGSAIDAPSNDAPNISNNTSTGYSEIGVPAGVGNDIVVSNTLIFNGNLCDIALFGNGTAYILGGTIKNIGFINLTAMDSSMTATGTINFNYDFTLEGSIKFDGVDAQSLVVSQASADVQEIAGSYNYQIKEFTQLNNAYKIDGSSENFVAYYKDTGRAIVMYDERITVDTNDFSCTNGTIISSTEVTDGNALCLYLTVPSASDTPITGFVDEQLLPAIVMGLVSVFAVVLFGKKRKMFAKM